MFEDIKIYFWQIWYFGVNGTEWVNLQLGIVLTKTSRRFDLSDRLSNQDGPELDN